MKNIPNILSLFRIILIPFFVWQMMKGQTTAAAIILVVSALTDLLDGFLARRFGWVTQLGKVLDPTADKLTQVTVCIVLAINLRPYWIFFALILFKDLVMLIIGGYLFKNGIKIEGAKWFGKLATAFFYIAMCLIVFFPTISPLFTRILLTLTLICTFTAGILYIPQLQRYKHQLNSSHKQV